MNLIDQVHDMQHNVNSHKVYMHKIKIKVASIVVFVIVCVFVNDCCFVFSIVFTVVLRCCLCVDACLHRITMKIEFFLIYYEAYTTDTCIKLYNKQHIFSIFMPAKNCNIFEHIKSFLTNNELAKNLPNRQIIVKTIGVG